MNCARCVLVVLAARQTSVSCWQRRGAECQQDGNQETAAETAGGHSVLAQLTAHRLIASDGCLSQPDPAVSLMNGINRGRRFLQYRRPGLLPAVDDVWR